jgi:hypothetical protein
LYPTLGHVYSFYCRRYFSTRIRRKRGP